MSDTEALKGLMKQSMSEPRKGLYRVEIGGWTPLQWVTAMDAHKFYPCCFKEAMDLQCLWDCEHLVPPERAEHVSWQSLNSILAVVIELYIDCGPSILNQWRVDRSGGNE